MIRLGPGNNHLAYWNASEAVVVDLKAGVLPDDVRGSVYRVTGSMHDDAIVLGQRAREASGYDGNDVIWATRESDTFLEGGNGDDILYGRGGDDVLLGGWDNDVLYGGAGDDSLDGSKGIDDLWGNAGFDTCINGPHRHGCER